MKQDSPRTFLSMSKGFLRKFIPASLLRQRDVIARLGPRTGRIYARLRLLDALGVRTANQRLAPASTRSFVFVCFGNIMRSAMAEFLMRQALNAAGMKEEVRIASAGLHASAGHEAHPWAKQAAAELGIFLDDHRAKLLTRQMAEEFDCILAMDFQNKAELLALYPEWHNKICMLSAYGEAPWKYREIPDPYLGDLETTRVCSRRLQTCVRNLLISIFPSSTQRFDGISRSDKGRILHH